MGIAYYAGPSRVLIVDDNRDAAEMVATMFEIMGFHTQLAFDGRTALEAAATFHPDVVILDIGMPDMSGLAVAKELRRRDATRDCVLVALSGWGSPTMRAASAEAGFDAHLTKPAQMEDLLNAASRPRKAKPAANSVAHSTAAMHH
jgi:DNA-binding response OmpR family regulator